MSEKRCPCGFPRSVCWRCSGPDPVCEKVYGKGELPPGAKTGELPLSSQEVEGSPDKNRPILVGGLVHPLRDRLLWGFLGLAAGGFGIGWIAGFIVGRWG